MYETIIVKTFKEFADFIKMYKGSATNIGYDVETNAKDIHSKDHEVIGFSLAFSKDVGIYVPLKALDYQVPVSDKRLIEKTCKEMFKRNEVTVYNCMHEYPATLNWLNLELPKIHDVFVMVKLMMGNAEQYEGDGGLKIQASMHLGFDNWSDDLKEYFDLLRNRSEKQIELANFLRKYYDDSDIQNLLTLINNIPEEELEVKTISYEYIPYKVIGRYGSLDSTVLLHLYEFYKNWMAEESSRLGVDLNVGYDCWMKHHYAGYTLERNGAYWNDEKAQEVENWCTEGMLDSLKKLILSPLSESWCRKCLDQEINTRLMLDCTNLIAPEYTPLSITKTSIKVKCNTDKAEMFLHTMSLTPKVTKKEPDLRKYTLKPGNFRTIVNSKIAKGELSESYIQSLTNAFYRKELRAILATNDTKYIAKSLVNPNANGSEFKRYVSNLLLTDTIRFAKLYFDLIKVMENPNFDIDYYKDFVNESGQINNEVKYPKTPSNPKYAKYVKKFDITEFKQKNPNYTYQDTDDSRFLEFVDKLSKSDNQNKFRIFVKQLNKSHLSMLYSYVSSVGSYALNSIDDNTMIELYSYYKFTGIDIDDRSTWNDSFEWLFNFRWFKKYGKLMSTYINGSVGRKSVWLVPKAEFESGEPYTKRSCRYFSKLGVKIRSNPAELVKYDMVLQTTFWVNMADSGRWTATFHTIPSGTTIKGIITSRYKGGVIAMPDCSQAEVRVLARAAQEANLISAFRQGLDIHRYVASLTNHIPIEDVTPIQRKVAKSAVFGLLYGESEKAFADEHFGGDVTQAHEVFEYFFNAFPGVKTYIETCHKNYDDFQKVILPITGRFLDLSNSMDEDDESKVYRISQNGPIQGTTADVAGLILYKICEHIIQNALKSKPFCFIHDSIEIDLHPDETFRMLDTLKSLFNNYPDEQFGIPMASDIVFSCNMGAEIDVEELIHDEDYNEVTITLKGYSSDIDDVLDKWRSVYDLVEKDETFEETCKDEYVPLEGLFMKKVIISKEMGTTKHKVEQRYHIIRKYAELSQNVS